MFRCAPRRRRPPTDRRWAGRAAGSALTTIGSPMNGLAATAEANFGAELSEGEMQGALVDQAEGGAVPEGRGAAACPGSPSRRVRRTDPEPGTHPAHQVLHRRLAVRGAEQGGTGGGQCGELRRRTFEGPQPKRPSAGLRSAGIVSWAGSAMGQE